MSRRGKIRLVCFISAAVLVLGGLFAESKTMLVSSRTEVEYGYRRSLNDLTDYVSDMQHTLKKASYANTATMQGSISSQLLELSSGAKASMATLPFSEEKTEHISRFISQVGDYAMNLSKKASVNDRITEKDYENLYNMEEYAGKLSAALEEIQAHLSVEKAEIGKTKNLLNNVDEINSLPKFDDSLDEVAKAFSEYPELLYDGPFSDHIMQAESLYLEGKKEIGSEEAKKKAAKFLKCSESDLRERGTSETALSAFVFTGDKGTVHVTKIGGEIAYYKHSVQVKDKNLEYEKALEKAGAFIKENGIESFKESYYIINDNLCTINFSYLEDCGDTQVICYPDLIKVVVELKEGSVVEYDATGYLMNHHERDIPAPGLSLEEAKNSVSPNLKINDYAMAVTPTPGLDEVYCYEFKCTDKDGVDVLVYINADTGFEEQIFILTYSDNGILTI